MNILEVKNLSKSFGELKVLKEVSFELEKGKVLSIIGSSGGGKTTLLRCLNFLETANGGEIKVNGKNVFSLNEEGKPTILPEAQKSMGLVFQQFNLFPQYSVLGNLTLAPRLEAKKKLKPHITLKEMFKSPREVVKKRLEYKKNVKAAFDKIENNAISILKTTGLLEKKNSYPCELSGGQQQRVAIARALMLEPEILCFDEPTSALDPELTGEVLKVIKELKNSDRTMIIVTHEMEFAKNVSDVVIFMADGIIEEMGNPKELFENPKSEKLKSFLAKNNDLVEAN